MCMRGQGGPWAGVAGGSCCSLLWGGTNAGLALPSSAGPETNNARPPARMQLHPGRQARACVRTRARAHSTHLRMRMRFRSNPSGASAVPTCPARQSPPACQKSAPPRAPEPPCGRGCCAPARRPAPQAAVEGGRVAVAGRRGRGHRHGGAWGTGSGFKDGCRLQGSMRMVDGDRSGGFRWGSRQLGVGVQSHCQPTTHTWALRGLSGGRGKTGGIGAHIRPE